MRKIFILIIAFFFLFSFVLIVEAKSCDKGVPACGGWAGCEENTTQDGCLADCSVGEGFGGWAWPKCNCKLKTEGESECWCECIEECADNWCKGLGYAKGECKSKTEAECYEATETSCDDGKDNDGDGKIDCKDKKDCEGKICGKNKICKKGSCVEKKPICPANCEWIVTDCFCGEKDTEVESGQFCCGALSKKYDLKADCEAECKPACPEDCDNLAPVPCYCDSKLIEVDEEKYCFRGKVYTDQKKCKEAEAVPPEEEEEEEEEFICLPGAICIENPLKAKTFEELVNNIVNFIYKLALLIAPIMFIIAGLAFITAAGDPAKIKQAKDIALWTAIGLMVVLMATGIIKVIQEIFET